MAEKKDVGMNVRYEDGSRGFGKAILSQNFDVEEFVSSTLRSGKSLRSLRSDIRGYIEKIKAHLVAHVNKDYTKFVTLSTGWDGFEDALRAQRSLLENLKEKVGAISTVVSGTISEFKSKLDERAKLLEEREILEIFVAAAESIDRIEALLGRTQERDAFVDGLTEEILLERVSQEYARLAQYLWRGRQYPFVKELQIRSDGARRELINHLQIRFAGEVITPAGGAGGGDEEALDHILRSFENVGNPKEAERTFTELVILPFLKDTFTKGRLDEGGPRGRCSGLSGLYNEFGHFIEKECATLLIAAARMDASPGTTSIFDFFGNSIWTPCVNFLVEACPSVFSSGAPDVFRSTFLSSVKFVDTLDMLRERFTTASPGNDEDAGSKKVPVDAPRLRGSIVSSLWNHKSTRRFFDQWNQDVYFQLRKQDILKPLQQVWKRDSVESGPPRPPESNDARDALVLECSRVVWSSVRKCWGDEVYISTLQHRFLHLSLQILARYANWLGELSAELPTGTLKSSTLVHALHDCIVLRRQVESDKWLGTLPSMDCACAFREASKMYDAPAARLITVLSEGVAQNSEQSMQAVRSIAAAYRMTSKPMPTKPSAFLTNIVRPLGHFSRLWTDYVPEETMRQIVDGASLHLVRRYLQVSRELIATVKKTEDSLARLRRLRSSARGGNRGGSDDDGTNVETRKIRKQMALDAELFAEKLKALSSNGKNEISAGLSGALEMLVSELAGEGATGD